MAVIVRPRTNGSGAVMKTAPAGAASQQNEIPWDPWRRFRAASAVLAAAWLVAFTADALGMDWLILLVAWGAIGSLLRAGRGLLDRAVLAGLLLAALLIGGGLVFSVWPWGLEPVPVGGSVLSVVGLAAVVSGRRPRRPRGLTASDSIIVGAGALTWWYLTGPTNGKSFADQLPYIAAREDFFNHYTLFDAIHRIGGYAFIKQGATRPFMSDTIWAPTAMRFYPSGSHYLDAVFDIFLRSDVNPGPSIPEFERFVSCSVLTAALLAGAVTWAARWIAGPGLAGWRRGAVLTAVAALAGAGQLTTLYWQGFTSHTAGLVVLALAVAVAARPPRSVREQVLLLAAALVCSAFIYNLTAVMTSGMVAVAAFVYRRRLARHWRFALIVAVPVVAVAAVPYLAQMTSGMSASTKFLASGSSIRFSRGYSIAAALVGVSALAARNGRRSPVWRVAAISVVWTCAFAVLMGLYSYHRMAVTSYYYEKLVEGAWVVSLACCGGIGLLLKPGAALGAAGRRRARFAGAGAALVVGVASGALTGVVPLAPPRFLDWAPKQDISWGESWRAGYIVSGFWIPLAPAVRHGLIGDDRPTIIVYFDSGHDNRSATMFVGSLHHDRGRIRDDVIDQVAGSDGLAAFDPHAPSARTRSRQAASVANLENGVIQKSGVPLRVVVWNRDLARVLTDFGAGRPALHLDVVYLGR